jgi:cytochrome c oxidase assembly protein subunit 11
VSGQRRVVRRALAVAVLAFVFCFSLVPLYRIACEVVFGIKLEQGGSGEAQAAAHAVDTSRWVTVEFDAGVNSQLPWSFRPAVPQIRVHPGQPTDGTALPTIASGESLRA